MSLGALAGGFLNPLTVPAHLLTLVGLGLLVGRQPRGGAAAALAFIAGLAIGLTAIAFGAGLTPALDILLVSNAIVGGLLAAGMTLPRAVSAGIAAVCGVALGLDSPPQVISLRDATTALVGTAIGASGGLALVILAASHLRRDWQRIGVRIAGSWIAASAALVLALRFSRGMLFGM
jgi:urease accessory protein